MYENILLESGKIFRGSRISGVGGQVVDDSQDITIIAAGYGMANIVSVNNPPAFVPNVMFPIIVEISNTSIFDDVLFIRITNSDTNEILGEANIDIPAGQTAPPFPFQITLTQTTDFHGTVEAGHEE